MRLFASPNGDSIVDASVNIYVEMEHYLSNLNGGKEDKLKKMMMKPRLTDLCLVITNICQIPDPEKNFMKDYGELWAH